MYLKVGNVSAQLNLGLYYDNRIGGEKIAEKAIELFQKTAQNKLGYGIVEKIYNNKAVINSKLSEAADKSM